MTTYELPREPEVDVLWTTSSAGASQPTVTMRWDRAGAGWKSDTGVHRDWHELLNVGVVHEQHPELGDAQPPPWYWDEAAWCIRDATGRQVDPHDRINNALIVRAVNECAKRFIGGES